MISLETDTVILQNGISITGYDGEYIFDKIVTAHSFYEQTLLEKWFIPNEAKVVYDIGANIGNHSVYFAATAPEARVYSFEPIPENYAMLTRNIADNNLDGRVFTFQKAIGDSRRNALMDFTHESNFGSASIIDSNELSAAREVEVITIDSLRLPPPDFIKIDVEGYELHVLKGMYKTLMALEKSLVWVEIDSRNSTDIYDFMDNCGFVPASLDLDVNNNVLWAKNSRCAIKNRDLFSSLINESSLRRLNWIALGNEISRFRYEQNKACDLSDRLVTMKSELSAEQKNTGNLTKSLAAVASSLAKEQEINAKYKQTILKQKIDLDDSRKKNSDIQTELDMFRNSRIIKIVRFWVWHIPKKIRNGLKSWLNKFGRWLYVKLLPYPRLRIFFSKINGFFNIYKNPQTIVAGTGVPPSKVMPVVSSNQLKTLRQMNVAVIVDEFSYNSFRFEFNALPVEPDNWRGVFENNKIDLFFCESAWAGADSLRRPWRGQIYASINFQKENRCILLDIIDYCNRNHIPTAFWNKEDPTHYGDRVHDFVKTALLFDHIFTTAEECIEKYRHDFNHKNVHLLMFATQPKLFNPVERFERTDDIIFAGSWYKQHPDRCNEMSKIFDTVLAGHYPLKIYNRHSGDNDPNHEFPEKYKPYIYPGMPHDDLDNAYKASTYALNINTVIGSATMFARRVFELMSSNTLVISNESIGMRRLFGKNIVFTDGSTPVDLRGDREKRDKNLYEVLSYHTYKQRFVQILKDMGINYLDATPRVSVIYHVAGSSDAESAIRNFFRLDWDNKRCVLVIDAACIQSILQEIAEKYNSGAITVRSAHYDSTYNIEGDSREDDTEYRINANYDLPWDFIRKAMAHADYLEKKCAIKTGENKYRFVNVQSEANMLVPAGCNSGETLNAYVI